MEPSDHTRALLRAYRAALEPPPGTLERQRARVQARLAEPPIPAPRRIWPLLAGVAALLALGIAGLGLYIDARVQRAVDASLAERSHTPDPAPGTARLRSPARELPARHAVVATPPAVTPPSDASEPAATPHLDVTEPATATTDASEAGEPTAATRRRSRPAAILDADTLREEGVLLSQARDALARGEWARVLTHVEQHRRAHPQGALLEERLVLEAAAACESGDRPRGQAALRALRRRFPGSLALSRVAAVCAGEADE